TGLRWRGAVTAEGEVSVRFAKRSLADALETLLHGFNYALVSEDAADPGDRRLTLIIVGRKSDGIAMSARLPDRTTRTVGGASITAERDSYRAVQRLAEQGRIDALREAATHGDLTTRALAIQRLARESPADALDAAADAARSEDSVQRVLAVQTL